VVPDENCGGAGRELRWCSPKSFSSFDLSVAFGSSCGPGVFESLQSGGPPALPVDAALGPARNAVAALRQVVLDLLRSRASRAFLLVLLRDWGCISQLLA
jgi:hypothetical protein